MAMKVNTGMTTTNTGFGLTGCAMKGRLLPVLLSCGVLTMIHPAPAGATDDFMSCGSIVSDAERLACYDDVYRSLSEVAQAPGPSVTEEAQVPLDAGSPGSVPASPAGAQTVAEQKFGFPRQPDPDALAVLRSSIVRVAESSSGRPVYYFENGQVWTQSESRRARVPEPPVAAEISPGRFGAFFMVVDGAGGQIKVKRIR